MSSFATANTRGADYVRPAFIGALSAIQICILLWAYSFSPHCTNIASYSVCLIPSQIGLRALAFLFVFGLIVLARPNIRNLLCCDDRTEDVTFRLVGVQVVGFCLIMLPWAVGFRSSDPITFALVPWMLGGCLAVFGAALALFSPRRWQAVLAELRPISLTVLAASLLAPEIIPVALDLWHFLPLREVTFQSVVFVLKVFGVEAIAKPSEYVLSSDSFSIRIDPACSGVEGFALVTLFLGCYFYAFKEHLRFPNVLVLLPIGLLISWAFNCRPHCGSVFNWHPWQSRPGRGGISRSCRLADILNLGFRGNWCLYVNVLVKARQYCVDALAGRLDSSLHIAIRCIHGSSATTLDIRRYSRSLVLRKSGRDLVRAGGLPSPVPNSARLA